MEARLGLLALQSLFDAASKGDAALTKRLLKKGTPPNAMDPDGDTPLICAAQGRVILQDHLPDMSLRKSETPRRCRVVYPMQVRGLKES